MRLARAPSIEPEVLLVGSYHGHLGEMESFMMPVLLYESTWYVPPPSSFVLYHWLRWMEDFDEYLDAKSKKSAKTKLNNYGTK